MDIQKEIEISGQPLAALAEEYMKEIRDMFDKLNEDDVLFIRRVYTILLHYVEKRGRK